MKPSRKKPAPPLWLGKTALFCFFWAIPGATFAQVQSTTLSAALEAALARNPSIHAVENQRKAAEARTREAGRGRLPTLSLASGYTRYEEPNIVVPIHRAGVFPPLDDQIYEARFQLQVPLYDGGRTRAHERAAQASVEENRAQEDLARIRIVEEVGRMFVQAGGLEDRARLTESRMRSLRRRRDELARLLEEGRVSPADFALISAAVETARADSAEIESKKWEIAVRLGQLVRAGGPVFPSLAGLDAVGGAKQEEIGSVPLDRTAPQVSKARAQLTRAGALRSLAARSFRPEVRGFALYSYRSGADLDPIGEWAAGVTLQLPLFEGGRRLAGLDAARASLRAAQSNLRSVQDTQDAELKIALERGETARVRRRHVSSAVEETARFVAAYQEMYEAGRVSLSELLAQEAELLQLKIQERDLAYQEMLAALHSHAAAGTLTPRTAKKIIRSMP